MFLVDLVFVHHTCLLILGTPSLKPMNTRKEKGEGEENEHERGSRKQKKKEKEKKGKKTSFN